MGRRDAHSDKDHDYLTAKQEYQIDILSTVDGIFQPYQADVPYSDKPQYFLDGYEDLDGDGFFNTAEFVWGTGPVDPGTFPILPVTGCVQVPDSVPADGSSSVTIALQAVIDTTPDGGCLEFPLGARYRSDGELTIFDHHDFTLSGNGAKLFTKTTGHVFPKGSPRSGRQQLSILSGSNITVEDLVIDGPNERPRFVPTYEFEAGVKIMGTQGAVLRNLRITEVYGDFVQIGRWGDGSGLPDPARDVLVTGGDFDVAGRSGVDMSLSSESVTFEGNSFRGMGRSGINFELLPGMQVAHAMIANNTWSRFGLFWVGSQARGPATDITFVGNQLKGESMRVKIGPSDTSGVRHSDWAFIGNSSNIEVSGSEAIFNLRNLDGFTAEGNQQTFKAGTRGLIFAVHDVCGITYGENDFLNWQTMYFPGPPTC